MKRNVYDWEAMHDQIVDMIANKYSNHEIAQALGVKAANQVRNYRIRAGLGYSTVRASRPVNEDKLNEVIALTKRNTPIREIAEITGLHRRQVSRYKKRAGLSKEPHKFEWTDAKAEQAENLLKENASYTEVARTIGCSFKAISTRFSDKYPSWTMDQQLEYRSMLRKANKQMNKAYGKRMAGQI